MDFCERKDADAGLRSRREPPDDLGNRWLRDVHGIEIGPDDHVYVCNRDEHQVLKLMPEGKEPEPRPWGIVGASALRARRRAWGRRSVVMTLGPRVILLGPLPRPGAQAVEQRPLESRSLAHARGL